MGGFGLSGKLIGPVWGEVWRGDDQP